MAVSPPLISVLKKTQKRFGCTLPVGRKPKRNVCDFSIRDAQCAGLEPSRSDLRFRRSAIRPAARISSLRGGEPLVAT
jgi:hypothetical protein